MPRKGQKINYPKRRKQPQRHAVKSHKRKGKLVRSFLRGHGSNPIKPLKRRVITRFGVKHLRDLPLHKNFYVVTGLAEKDNPKSRFRARVIATNPEKAKQIIQLVLFEEWDVEKMYNFEVMKPTQENFKRAEKLKIPKNWFKVMSPHPLYFIDKTTGLVKEFHQGITYRPRRSLGT